ncbi:magnesium transporter NIPA2 isoform X1 [Neodiprion virginianus]|uniref:magnesium transporter NIPA2 isoform X1 n=2 Tax=Neodiprion virginianus TaxID=2961670 RepID=UPI001EE73E47|nr:magnesium transporter NIPA2 isoform X1 [Neodiprion virginianus]
MNQTSSSGIDKPYDTVGFYIGLGLAIGSSIFIGGSFIIKKKALIRIQQQGSVRAGSGGFAYLKEWIWWAGLLSMGIGEAANFAAYAFAPASLVTPLGALSVLIAAVLASKFLNENLNLLGKIGCFLCIVGSTMIVIHAPKEEEIENLEVLLSKIQEPGFICYIVIIITASVFIVYQFESTHGRQNVIIYVLICSSIGSLTVMSCKGLGLALKETISGSTNELGNWLTWVLLLTVILCVSVQMNYLNKALDLFNTGIVTPVYYVFFTTFVIMASAILFQEWRHMSATNILGSVCGFSTVLVAIVLLNAFKDLDISYRSIQGILRPRRELVTSCDFRWEAREHSVLISNQSESDQDNTYGSPSITRTV